MSVEGSALPSISVVVPVHNAGATLSEQLEALCGQEYAGTWEVVVVDNRSTDASAAIARSYADRFGLRIVKAGDGSSVAYARNVGVAATTGELLVFVDADDVAAPGLLAAYGQAAATFEVMGGHVDGTQINDPVTVSWRYPPTDGRLPVAFDRYAFFIGANCAVRRHVFDVIGGFDETLEFVGEDVDFSIRAELAGFEVGWVAEAVVHYRYRRSLRELASQFYVYGRGSVVLYERYHRSTDDERRLVVGARKAAFLTYRLPDLVRGRAQRGRWIMQASAVGGQIAESVRRRVLYIG